MVIAHVFLATTVEGAGFGAAVADAPAALADRFLHGEFGSTGGGECNLRKLMDEYVPLCATYPAADLATMLRERVPVDVALLLGGLILGMLGGVAGGRWCAVRPRTHRTRVLHVATALQLSCPPYFQ